MNDAADDDFDALIESAYAEIEVVSGRVGDPGFTPVMPSPLRPGVDRGIAGSLYQTQARLRRERRKLIGPPWKDLWTVVPIAVVVLSGIGLVGVWTSASMLPLGALAFLMLLLAFLIGGSGWVLHLRRGPAQGEGTLKRTIAAEHRVARQLQTGLAGSSWVVLHDRLLPHTEHRVPFLAVGPSGVALIAVMPPGPYLILKPTGVMAGDDELTSGWLLTKLWEVRYLVERLVAEPNRDLPFRGLVLGLAAIGYDPAANVRSGWSSNAPHRIGDYPIRAAGSVGQHLRYLPVTLGPAHVDQLVNIIDQRCPPAPYPDTTSR